MAAMASLTAAFLAPTGARTGGRNRHTCGPLGQSGFIGRGVVALPTRTRMISGFKCMAASQPDPLAKLVGMGGCGIDYLASVATYPSPDDKIRTQQLEVQGGGNAGNALTAAARLGAAPVVITKVGGDGLGQQIAQEMRDDGIDTSPVLFAEGHPSPFTYIIVDRAGATRTCIHTPGAPLEPEEVTDAALDAVLGGARLVYFDGRLTEAAVKVAAAAKARGIPLLVEAERLRPSLPELLSFADYIVTSKHFPQDWTGEAGVGDAVLGTLASFPNAKWIITTLGVKGAVLVSREVAAGGEGDVELEGLLARLLEGSEGQEVLPAGAGKVRPRAGGEVTSPRVVSVPTSKSEADKDKTAASAAAAALAEAVKNAGDPSASSAYEGAGGRGEGEVCSILFSTAADMGGAEVVDTTGAGDSFIGSVCYGVVSGLSLDKTLALASSVAAAKCTELGPRPGLPRRDDIDDCLLG